MKPVTFLGLLAGESPGGTPSAQGTCRQDSRLAAGRHHAAIAGITDVGSALMSRATRLPGQRRQRIRRRGQLRDLSDHLLRDIGLRREQWSHATSKPVWW